MKLQVIFQNLTSFEFTLGKLNDGFWHHSALAQNFTQTPTSPLKAHIGMQRISGVDREIPILSSLAEAAADVSCVWTSYDKKVRFGLKVHFGSSIFGIEKDGEPNWKWLLDSTPDKDASWQTPDSFTGKIKKTITTDGGKVLELSGTPNRGRTSLTMTLIIKEKR